MLLRKLTIPTAYLAIKEIFHGPVQEHIQF